MNPKFEEWLDEFQGFVQRRERLDIILEGLPNKKVFMDWVRAAYFCGYEDGIQDERDRAAENDPDY